MGNKQNNINENNFIEEIKDINQRKLGSNFRVTNDFLFGAINYDEGW